MDTLASRSKAKKLRDETDESQLESEQRFAKAKRHDIEIPEAEADIKLAEKLDKLLIISDTRKPRFLTNRANTSQPGGLSAPTIDKVRRRGLSKEELHERVSRKYDTLVPELPPGKATVGPVKILSTCESVQMGKLQARKQLERQMELNSVSGNQSAHQNGVKGFKFKDGYELPMNFFAKEGSGTSNKPPRSSSSLFARHRDRRRQEASGADKEVHAKTVRFANTPREAIAGEKEDQEDDDDDYGDLTESDCSTEQD